MIIFCNKKRRSQRGVALLMALGLLMLLMVTAIAFAAEAILARKAAANTRNRSTALFLAKSALGDVLYSMKHMCAVRADVSTAFDKLISVTNTADASNGSGGSTVAAIKDMLEDTDDEDSILQVFVEGTRFKPSYQPEWKLIFDKYDSDGKRIKDSASEDDDSKIIGRVAYYALPPYKGQISLSHALRGDPDIAATPEKNKRNWKTRVGVDVRELDLSRISYLNETGNNVLAHVRSKFATEDYSADRVYLNEYGNAYKYTDSTDTVKDTPAPDYATMDEFFTATGTMLDDTKKSWLRQWFAGKNDNEAEVYVVDHHIKDNKLSDYANYYHRFSLVRKDLEEEWENKNTDAAVEKLLGGDKSFHIDDKSDVKTDALPFLRMIGSNGGAFKDISGGASGIELRRKQIAANFLDYCDKDDTPTSDSSDWVWGSSGFKEPSYTGNEKTPYINEVAVRVIPMVVITRTAKKEDSTDKKEDSTDSTKITGYSVSFDFSGMQLCNGQGLFAELIDMYFAELIDMYNVSGSAKLHVYDIEVNGYVTIMEGENHLIPEGKRNFTLRSNANSTVDSFVTSDYGNMKYRVGVCGIVNPDSVPLAPEVTVNPRSYGPSVEKTTFKVSVSITSIKIGGMRLVYGSEDGNDADYVRELKMEGTAAAPALVTATKDIEVKLSTDTSDRLEYSFANEFALGFEVADPRVNLYQTGAGGANWTFRSKTWDGALSGAAGLNAESDGSVHFTFAEHNTSALSANGAAGTNTDGEDIAHLSTNYIRNARMISPMELGAIHRGAKWETINLSNNAWDGAKPWNYNTKFDYKKAGETEEKTGSSYAEGDGEILNQIKMTDNIYSPGKVNLNEFDDSADPAVKYDVLKALFSRVGVGGAKYSIAKDDTDLGTVLDDSTIDTIVQAVARTGSRSKFFSRAQILDRSDSTIGDSLYNAGSSKVERDALAGKVLALASTAMSKDDSASDTYTFVIVAQSINDIGGGVKVSREKADGDVVTSGNLKFGVFEYDPANNVYYDEITGEVKMLVTVEYDSDKRQIEVVSCDLFD